MTHTVRRGEKKGLTAQAKRKVWAPDAEGPGGSGASGHYGLGSSVGSGWGRLGGGGPEHRCVWEGHPLGGGPGSLTSRLEQV